jgi:endonuclease/exonuclease/phosphatase family metal-dependent hydrolase
LQRIADIIRHEGADVVGLQEVDNHFGARSNFADEAAWLASALHMHYCYGANLDLNPLEPGQARRQYGTAVLSRLPILSCNNTLLPKTVATNEQRGLLDTVVNVKGVPVRVYNTHLQPNANDRTVQVQAIMEQIGHQQGPLVLMGDLNVAPTASELAPLYSSLTDAWQAAGSGDGYSYPVGKSHARIDYIFVSGDMTVNQVAVATTPATAVGSDHLPVVAELSVPGSGVGIGLGQ